MANPVTVIAAAALASALGAVGCGGTNGQGTEGAFEPTGATARPLPEADTGDQGAPEEAVGGKACVSDGDCVPAECCHPRTCTHKDGAPDCRDMMCTMDCRGGTMDCGGGRCLCREGRCEAELLPPKKPKILSDPPPPPVPQ
jgi:hypothetical protein